MHLMRAQVRLVGVTLLLLILIASGCGEKDRDSELTARLLGVTRLVALKPVPGEPQLQQLVIVEADGDKLNNRSIAEAYAFEVSNDGKFIAYVGDNGLYVISTDDGSATKVSDLSPKFDLNSRQERVINKVMAWSPDNTRLAFVSGGDLYEVNVINGKEPQLLARRTPDQLTTKEGAPALAPRIDGITCPGWLDNNTLIYQDFYSIFNGQWQYVFNIMKVNADGSGKQLLIKDGQEPLVSPDKKGILYHQHDNFGGKIMLATVENTEEPKALSSLIDTDNEPVTYSWSGDGKYVVMDGFVINRVTKKQTVFTGELAQDPQNPRGKSTQIPSFSPDGRWIIFSTPLGPKLVEVKDGNFTYDSSNAYKPLTNLSYIRWIKGK